MLTFLKCVNWGLFGSGKAIMLRAKHKTSTHISKNNLSEKQFGSFSFFPFYDPCDIEGCFIGPRWDKSVTVILSLFSLSKLRERERNSLKVRFSLENRDCDLRPQNWVMERTTTETTTLLAWIRICIRIREHFKSPSRKMSIRPHYTRKCGWGVDQVMLRMQKNIPRIEMSFLA